MYNYYDENLLLRHISQDLVASTISMSTMWEPAKLGHTFIAASWL